MDSHYCGCCVILIGFFLCIMTSADPNGVCDLNCNTTDTNCMFLFNKSNKVPAGTNCTWTLQRVTKKNPTILKFVKMKLSGNDTLSVYDGDANETNLVTTITGRMDRFVGVMFKAKTTVVFHKRNNQTSELTVKFNTSGCVLNVIPKWTGRVISPVYLPARGLVSCTYNLQGLSSAPDKRLDLAFSSFNVADGNISISDGNKTLHYTGTNLPNDFLSANRKVSLKILFPNATTKSDFEGFYASVDKGCSQTLVVNDEEKISLDMPAGQSPLTDCRWLLTSPHGRTLVLNITRLTLAEGADRLVITEGGSINGRVLEEMVTLTSGGAGHLVQSNGHSLMVRLIAGEIPLQRHVKIIAKSTVNGAHLYDSGTVSLKPQKTNRTSSRFFYQFSSPVGQQAQLLINTLPNKTLLYPTASISFYDGLQLNSPLLVKFSVLDVLQSRVLDVLQSRVLDVLQSRSTTQFFPVTASGSFLLMVADNFNKKQMFTANFTSILKGCNSIGAGLKGSYSLSSDVLTGQQCRWTIPARNNAEGNIILSPRQLLLQVNQTVTIYSGVLENGTPLRMFSRKSSKELLLPQISVPVTKGAELVFQSTNKCKVNCTQPVVNADFTINTKGCGGPLSANGRLSSPNFPNQYNLNSFCTWIMPGIQRNKTRMLYLSFSTFTLAKGHKFEVIKVNNGTKKTVGSYSGTNLPKDILIPKKSSDLLSMTFSAPPANQSKTTVVDQGFSAKYMLLDCGGTYTNSSLKISSPAKFSGVCVWIITVPLSSKKGTLHNIIQFNVNSNDDKTSGLVFHDGASAYDPLLPVKVTKGHSQKVMSRNNTLFIMYTSKASSKLSFNIQYSTYSCDKTNQCDNGMCIHPDWKCDGRVQCMDGTDELNCNQTSSSGVKTYWIPICLVVGLILGIVIAFVIPAIYRRFRPNRYREFRDISTPVDT